MQLVSGFEIRNFRSIRNIKVEGLTDFSSFCGTNNAGKSNVLKALNLFFNNETDPGNPIDIDRDYNRFQRAARRKAVISVEIHFRLPEFFNFRRELNPVASILGKEFSIRRTWTRDARGPTYSLDGIELTSVDSDLVKQFLSLIRFRYVPNRVLPIDIIRSEQSAVTDSLVRRLKFTSIESDRVFEHLREQAATLAGNLGAEFQNLISNFSDISLRTPRGWGDLIFNLGFQISEDIDDELQGSGAQSVLMLETLALVDRDYYKQFGWRQATLWGFEEPESSLHHTLEAGVASKLLKLSTDDAVRLQIFCTSHSNAITETSTSRFLVKREGQVSECISLNNTRDLKEIWDAGVAPWIHPLLRNPTRTIVLFEGKFDEDIFKTVKAFLPGGIEIEAFHLGTLDHLNASGGVERLRQYLENNKSAIKQREGLGAIYVILDWDAANQQSSFQKISDSKTYYARGWGEGYVNAELSKDFRGIERALGTRLISDAANDQSIQLIKRDGKLSIHPQDYDRLKVRINERIRTGVSYEDVEMVVKFLRQTISS